MCGFGELSAINCTRHEPNVCLNCKPAAACPEVLETLLQDIAYSSDRSFADQRRSEGSNLDWELEVQSTIIIALVPALCFTVTSLGVHCSEIPARLLTRECIDCRTLTSVCSGSQETRREADAPRHVSV